MSCLQQNGEACFKLLKPSDQKADEFMDDKIKAAGGDDKVSWAQLKSFVDSAGFNKKFSGCVDKIIDQCSAKQFESLHLYDKSCL